ncbi:hypothetical protein UZ36_08010 [Candidatus Nitromaritima sp. SCGC AAA799-C22]|nr:hypothetical protein UZ36_08010 [Candidatus Nitromaritima sp. SCGC AAA799-C22]
MLPYTTFDYNSVFFASVLAVYFLGWQMPLTYAETLFVKSSNTNVYERDSIQSKIVQLVQEGTEVNTIQKSKGFYKITLPTGETGWILEDKLTNSYSKKSSSISNGNLILPLDDTQDFALRESDSGSSIRARDLKQVDTEDLGEYEEGKESDEHVEKNK